MDNQDNQGGHSNEVESLPQGFGNDFFADSALGRILGSRNEKGPYHKFEITRRDIFLVGVGMLAGITIGFILTFLAIRTGN